MWKLVRGKHQQNAEEKQKLQTDLFTFQKVCTVDY